jgi:hypothetical protein
MVSESTYQIQRLTITVEENKHKYLIEAAGRMQY